MKLSSTQIQAGPAAAATGLLPLAALCCLVVALVGMGLRLPWFRRQMRLGSRAQLTAATSSQRELTARVTNVPTQGVFRQWSSLDESPPPIPPPPPRKEKARPKSAAPAAPSSPTEPPPSVKSKAKPASLPVPPPVKSKSAPPSRRNPNAPAFAVTSAATAAKPTTAKRTSAPPSAANPVLLASSSDHDEATPSFHLLNVPVNGHVGLVAPKSPKPSKKAPKVIKSKNKVKKTPSFARMVPPPTVPAPKTPPPKAFHSDSDEEGDGTLTFRLPDATKSFEVQPSFLAGVVADSDECDA